MRLIEIEALSNGVHRNQTGYLSTIPYGWAVIPEDMVTENFPFGDITVKTVDGVPVVTSWTPGVIPDPEPEPEPEPEPTTEDIINAMLGVSE